MQYSYGEDADGDYVRAVLSGLTDRKITRQYEAQKPSWHAANTSHGLRRYITYKRRDDAIRI